MLQCIVYRATDRSRAHRQSEEGEEEEGASLADAAVRRRVEPGDLGVVGRVGLRLVDGDDRVALRRCSSSAKAASRRESRLERGRGRRTVKAEYSPLKPTNETRVVSSPWFEGKKRVRDRTEGNLAGLRGGAA